MVTTQVFIVAPTPALRAGLRALLASPSFHIIGESSTLLQAPSAEVTIVAGDLTSLITRFLIDLEGAAVVALTDEPSAVARISDLPLRGWAIVTSDAGSEELQAAVLAASQGFIAIPRPWASQVSSIRIVEPEQPGDALTSREREVLGLLSQGLPNKQIALRMQISEHTVKFHIASIFSKLGAASRTEAVGIGARRGLITL